MSLVVASFCALANSNEVHLVLENHLFYPSTVVITANTKVKLIIENKDATPEEFDSFDLNREKVLFAKSKTTIYIGPLDPGEYKFFGEFNPAMAVGKVVVKSSKQLMQENADVK
ncbi:MAG: cupredoxin domain-containing protein [Thalassotalea sp.]|nr:cupredoxin domain-containing protein [Thalassotalea sp.]MDG2392571.1 cupredoxin domain-containing protein [Thalassotalea sp.]